MKEKGIVALKADKTNPDPKIEEKLAELGRSAIPVNVLMVPGKNPSSLPSYSPPDTSWSCSPGKSRPSEFSPVQSMAKITDFLTGKPPHDS